MKIEIEKPVVPAWFDEWFKSFGGYKSVALYHLNRAGWGYALTEGFNDEEVSDWARKLEGIHKDTLEAQEYLSKAILFGYEVEKESLYYAKIKGWNNDNLSLPVYWIYITYEIGDSRLGVTCFVDSNSSDHVKTKTEWQSLGINDTNADFEEVE